MIRSKKSACRTKSLPTNGRSTCGRKLKGRVSFSSLPPSKIEFEQSESVKNTIIESRLAQFKNEKFRNQDDDLHQEKSTRKRFNESDKGHNDLDSVNELLIDILEEIEAENVTIEDFLRDAVHLAVLSQEDARKVLPSFTEFKDKGSPENDVNNNPTSVPNHDIDCDVIVGELETPLDNLLDLFMGLTTSDLSKCCNYTIGKLCQLTSYEDYENTQKIAASSCGCSSLSSSKWSGDFDYEICEESSDVTIDDFSSDASCISSSSLENFDTSSTGSDFSYQNVSIRQSVAKENTIRNTLPLLVENGILRPRQVWNVLETLDNDANSFQNILNEMLQLPEMDSLKLVTEKINNLSRFQSSNATTKLPKNSESSSRDHGYSSNGSESDTPTFSKPIPFTSSTSKSQFRKNLVKTSTPKKLFHGEENNNDQDTEFLSTWCNVNGLHPSTSYILRCNGYVTEDDVTNISNSEMENLTDLSWKNKLKLCIAIETLKLDKTYLAYHEKLRMLSKAFDNSCL